MSELRLKQYEIANGDRLWTIVDGDGMPDFDATNFINSKYLLHKASNTLRNIAFAIRQFRLYEIEERISLRKRLHEARILNTQEIQRLIGYCGKRRNVNGSEEKKSKIVPLKGRKAKPNKKYNNPSTHHQRALYVGEFINFIVDDVVDGPYLTIQERTLLRREQLIFREKYKKLTPVKVGRVFDPERSLKEEEAKSILELTQGKSEELADSIFKHQSTRRRNFLIIEIFLATGVRASEVAGLMISDVDVEKSSILFRRNSKEKRNDVRKNRPGFKTRERAIVISQDLMSRLDGYITSRKNGRPRQAKHNYVFCAEGPEARALSLSAVYKIVTALKQVFGDGWERVVTPHVLRHTFFDIWFREANRKYDFKNKPELFDQVVSMAEMTGGWRPDSIMVAYYKQRFVFEQASEVTLATQRRMLNGPNS